jgi:2-dehydro-3-deoxyglucarate aldolase/4-hydroxy-2-oxoheptanedioate aldolase
MEQNKIKAGTMLSEICFSNFPIIAKNNDLDFFIVDNEHGYFDYSDIAQLSVKSALAGLDMIVRIGDSSRGHITKLADMGVCGFLLPMTNTPEDIEQVIRFAKYPPVGKRGVSTTRAHTLYNPPPLSEYMPAANERMKIYAQIETVEGVRNIDAILAVPEVSGIFIGPNDLSVDMECINDKESVLQAVIRIIEAANAAGKPCGIITGDKMLIETARQHGIKMVSIGSELNMLINGCKKIKEALTNG